MPELNDITCRHLIRLFLFCDTPQWCMVDAMFIGFLLFLSIQVTAISAATVLSNCAFIQQTYLDSAAVRNQIQFDNQTSVTLAASYAFDTPSTYTLGLIYQFLNASYLVPFPILFNCTSIVESCQIQTIAGSTVNSRESESISVPLTPVNYTASSTTATTSFPFNQMGLYLQQGRYQLSNCTWNQGNSTTDPQQIFSINIRFEIPIGTSCTPGSTVCGPSVLSTCSPSTSQCSCLSNTTAVAYLNSSFCADTFNASNCQIFPTRCVTWCQATNNTLCICPTDTLKAQRNGVYVCELPVNALNCSANDTIRRCPFGQTCTMGQCLTVAITSSVTTSTTIQSGGPNDSTDRSLRIALGVIAGVLGASVLVLIGVFCWLRQRQKRRRLKAEDSLSPAGSSSKSSLYISPIQERGHSSSSNTIYQLPDTGIDTDHQARLFSPIYRTDSFRQAIQTGQRRPATTIERVSTKRDSFVDISSHSRDELIFPNYSTLQFAVPSEHSRADSKPRNTNVYQVMMPSPASPTVLTYAV